MKSRQEYIKKIEAKNRKLEDEIDLINEELTRIKSQETVLKQTNQSEQASDLVNKALESHVEQVKKQVKIADSLFEKIKTHKTYVLTVKSQITEFQVFISIF